MGALTGDRFGYIARSPDSPFTLADEGYSEESSDRLGKDLVV